VSSITKITPSRGEEFAFDQRRNFDLNLSNKKKKLPGSPKSMEKEGERELRQTGSRKKSERTKKSSTKLLGEENRESNLANHTGRDGVLS